MKQISLILILILGLIICMAIFLIIIYLPIKLINNNKFIENYDGRISNINTNEECANICIKSYGCQAYSFDDKDKKCYLSKVPVVGYPIGRLYTSEYKPYQYTCNKIRLIRNKNDYITPETQEMNRIFSCFDNAIGDPDLVYYKDDGIIKLENEIDLKKYENEYKSYDMIELNYPDEKIDIDINQQLNKTLNYVDTRKIIFEENNKYCQGDYLYDYKCSKNISLNNCLDNCKNNNNCVGVEWNDINNENICCPMKNIREMVNRNDKISKGKFYKKIIKNSYNDNDIYVKI